MIINKCETVVI